MTELRLGSKLTRKTATALRGRPLVVTLHPGYLELRQAGTRTSYPISYEAIYNRAAQIAADRARAEKLAAKKAKKPKGRNQ